MTRIRLAHSVVALIVGTLAESPGLAQNQLWLEQLGSIGDELASSVAPDGAGGVYFGGTGFGGPSTGNDAWIARHDGATGNRLWLRPIAASGEDYAIGAAPDGWGGVYIGGTTSSSLGGPSAGSYDVWLGRYDSVGNQLWIRQLGSRDADQMAAAASDGAAGVYLTGLTYGNLGGPSAGFRDPWLARYDATGNQLWVRQFGSPSDDISSAAAPDGSGGVYIGGTTTGSLAAANAGAYDAWLAHYDHAGNQLWIRQVGTNAFDSINAAASDGSGGVYIGGTTSGSLAAANAGAYDAWLAHYDAAGNQLWIRQLGTNASEAISAAAPDDAGGVFVGGSTLGSLGAASAGDYDAWLAQYDSAGNQFWIRQFGTNAEDSPYGATSDGSGGVFLGGMTEGDLGAPNAGGWDAWVARYDGVGPPQPTSYCTASTTANGCSASITANAQPSVTFTTPCVLSIASVEGQRQGLIFYGLDNTGFSPLPWSSGSSSFLCVKPPTQRAGIQNSGGAIASCSGTLSLDWNAFHSANPGALGGAIAAGSKVYAQGWFRDAPAPKSTNLSNALELIVAP